VIVAKRGGGDVTTIADALMRSDGPRKAAGGYFVIYIREGVYDEHVIVATKKVVFIGDGRDKTIITGSRSNFTRHNVHDSATLSKDS
jgi:pectinesterase